MVGKWRSGAALLQRGRYLDCFSTRFCFTWKNTIWLANRRIGVQETTYLLGLKVGELLQFFKYGDLQKVTTEIDYRERYLFALAVDVLVQLFMYWVGRFPSLFRVGNRCWLRCRVDSHLLDEVDSQGGAEA